jgi:hypothetical protein
MKRSLRRMASFLLSGLVMFALASCGNSGAQPPSGTLIWDAPPPTSSLASPQGWDLANWN